MTTCVHIKKILLLALLLIPLHISANDTCKKSFSLLGTIRTIGIKVIHKILPPRDLIPEELLALSTRPLKYYFEDSIEAQKKLESSTEKRKVFLIDQYGKPLNVNSGQEEVSPIEEYNRLLRELHVDPVAIKKFLHDFEQLKKARRHLQGLKKRAKFNKWLDKNIEQFLTKPVLELLLSRNYSMGDFLDHLHLNFLAFELARKKANPIYRYSKLVLKHPVLVAASVPLMTAIFGLLKFLWQLTVLGPGVQMINSYTEPVVQPLTFGAKQQGAKHFQGAAQKLQELLSGHDQMIKFKEELNEVTEKLKGISPEEARERWKEFELMYFRIFQKYQQILPAHLRDGRSLFRDWVLTSPVLLASALADFDNQYWHHKRLLDETEKEIANIKNSGKEVPEELIQIKRLHSNQILAAESRIAATLAGWKIYEFMYPEFSRADGYYVHKTSLNQAYETFKKHMHFDLYIEQFGKQMQLIMEELDFHYALQSEIKKVLDRVSEEQKDKNTRGVEAVPINDR